MWHHIWESIEIISTFHIFSNNKSQRFIYSVVYFLKWRLLLNFWCLYRIQYFSSILLISIAYWLFKHLYFVNYTHLTHSRVERARIIEYYPVTSSVKVISIKKSTGLLVLVRNRTQITTCYDVTWVHTNTKVLFWNLPYHFSY